MTDKIIRIDMAGTNCYLVKLNEGFILFDTGGPMLTDRKFNDRQEELVEALEKEGCFPDNLNLIVLTHGDIDHVYNAAYVRDRYNTKIALHYGDVPLVENPSISSVLRSFKFRSLTSNFIAKLMKPYIHNRSLKALTGFCKFTPDIIIDDSFKLSDFGLEADVLHIPGHTDGSICIVFQDGSLICGDTFFNMFKPRIALNACDYEMLEKSIQQLKNYNITTVYSGHGKPFELKRISI